MLQPDCRIHGSQSIGREWISGQVFPSSPSSSSFSSSPVRCEPEGVILASYGGHGHRRRQSPLARSPGLDLRASALLVPSLLLLPPPFFSVGFLHLSFNSLTGDLPGSFGSLSSLTTLYLQNNQFMGSINVLANLPLDDLNVVNNCFTGWIPDKLKGINNLQTGGNSWSSGPAPPPPPYRPPPPGRGSNSGQQFGGSNSPSGGGGKSFGIGAGGIAGIIISIFIIGGIITFFLIRKRTRKSSREESLEEGQPFTSIASNEVKKMKSIQISSTINTTTLPSSAPFSLKPPPIDEH